MDHGFPRAFARAKCSTSIWNQRAANTPPADEKRTRMAFPRRQFLRLAGAAVALPAVSRIARAQAYPSRQIRRIIGYPPGGSADITARLIAQWLTERLGQSVIVEGRPGGGTNIATEAVINAPPHGFTLLLAA